MVRLDRLGCVLAALLWPSSLAAQAPGEIARILQRLDRLEQENRALTAEVKALRAKLDAGSDGQPASEPAPGASLDTPPTVSLEERLQIQEKRTEELAQSKVETSQKFPIRLTGMALFNAFSNSRQNGGSDLPVVAGPSGSRRVGATLRQTVVGLEFQGPQAIWGGQVHGSAYMDFFLGGTLNEFRLRTASIAIDWKSRSFMVGMEKPIFNPREPSSLAMVGISPLTGAGNLWLWLPQARFEQDFHFTTSTGIRAQIGVIQTREVNPYPGGPTPAKLDPARPGLEGRYEFFHKFDEDRRIEFAPGFHLSQTHADGNSIPSQIFSMDWFFNPHRRVEFTGAFYKGQNVAVLGNGYQQGFTIYSSRAKAIESTGGWGQLTLHTAPRLDLHLFTGQQDDENYLLDAGRIGKNLLFGGNLYYRLAPNVILGWEMTQLRTTYIGQGIRINNRYDLALAYHF